MTPQIIVYIIIGITIVSYLFSETLDFLNLKSFRKDIPKEVADFYDKEKYQRSMEYHQTQSRFSFLISGISFVVSLALLSFGGFGWIDQFLRPFISNPTWLALTFFGAIMFASDVLTLPFQLYSTFVIEEKFGFNKTTVKTFFVDKLKGYVLGGLIGGGLLALLIFLVNQIGPSFWIWFGAITAAFVLFM